MPFGAPRGHSAENRYLKKSRDAGICMKVLLVIHAKAGIQTALYGFPLKLVPASVRRGARGNDGRVTHLTFMFRCDHQVMTVRRYNEVAFHTKAGGPERSEKSGFRHLRKRPSANLVEG